MIKKSAKVKILIISLVTVIAYLVSVTIWFLNLKSSSVSRLSRALCAITSSCSLQNINNFMSTVTKLLNKRARTFVLGISSVGDKTGYLRDRKLSSKTLIKATEAYWTTYPIIELHTPWLSYTPPYWATYPLIELLTPLFGVELYWVDLNIFVWFQRGVLPSPCTQ